MKCATIPFNCEQTFSDTCKFQTVPLSIVVSKTGFGQGARSGERYFFAQCFNESGYQHTSAKHGDRSMSFNSTNKLANLQFGHHSILGSASIYLSLSLLTASFVLQSAWSV